MADDRKEFAVSVTGLLYADDIDQAMLRLAQHFLGCAVDLGQDATDGTTFLVVHVAPTE